jgi:hypothetical protein
MSRHEYPSLRQGLEAAYCPSLSRDGPLIRDRSGRNKHGTHSNVTPTVVGGRMALGYTATPLAFTNLGPQINISAASGITYCAWSFGRSDTPSIISRGPGDYLYAYNSGQNLQVNYGGRSDAAGYINSAPMGSLQLANAWNHYVAAITGTANGGSVAFYCNGVAFSTITTPGLLSSVQPPNSFNWLIGLLQVQGTNYASNTSFDDIRVYRRALTAAEVRLLYSRPGIGLTPLPDRAAGLPRKLFVNDAGTWRDGDAYVNTGSGWRLGVPFVNDAGTWR